jgi:hypothetical protein
MAVTPGRVGGVPRGWQCLSCSILVTVGDMLVLEKVGDLGLELQALGRRLDRMAEVLNELTKEEEDPD